LVPKDRTEEFGVAGAHFYLCLTSFYVLILKKTCFDGFHMTVALRMMSNSRRISPEINAHLP
jgi:hypothetical protein